MADNNAVSTSLNSAQAQENQALDSLYAQYPNLDEQQKRQLASSMGIVLPEVPKVVDQSALSTGSPQLDLQQARQGLDTVENIAMKGTGINPSFAPISNVPTPYSGLPSTLRAPVPTPEEQTIIQAQELEKATKDEAAQNAKQLVEQDRARKGVEAQQENQAQISKVEAQVKEDQEKSGSNLFKGVGDAIAIMLGAYSQGLTGSKENPGIKAIEARIDREVQAKKYNAEQEAALHKLATDAAQLRLEQAKFMTDNALKIAQIEKLQSEVGQLGQQAVRGQEAASILRQPSIDGATLRQLQTMGKEESALADKYVAHPYEPNKFLRGVGSEATITKLKDFSASVSPIVGELESLIQEANSPEFSRLDIGERKKRGTRMVALIGNLRLPFTGPGPLLEAEYQRLKDSIGDINAIFSMPSWEVGKLKTVQDILRNSVKSSYSKLGNIDLPDPVPTAIQSDAQALVDRTRRAGNPISLETAEKMIARRKSGK